MATKRAEVYVATQRWLALSKEDQIKEVRQAMKEGLSNTSAAKKLGATPGTIAGIRFKNDIPSSHEVPQSLKPKIKPPRSLIRPSEAPQNGLPKLTSDWRVQCQHIDERGHRCGFKKIGPKYCKKHK